MVLWTLLIPGAAGASIEASSLESEFLALLDAERAAHGVAPLEPMDELVDGARRHSVAMRDAGYIFHNPDLASVLADGWYKLGENVGVGYSATTLHDAFMNSPGHRDNVIDPTYDRIGVGTAQVGGTIYVVFVFADMIGVAPEAPLEGAASSGPFTDDDGSPFEPAIEALAAADITSGCAERRFCPDDAVTRGQMAVFLTRALSLPAAQGDRFGDDDGSVFEEAIEALAAADITRGCAERRFCPDDAVTRGQMAVFLSRAAGIPAVEGDRFSDDDGSIFEPAIEALAGAGITRGCADDRFCPDAPVTRGQMAQLLQRAFDL